MTSETTPGKSRRLALHQLFAVSVLSAAGLVNFIDRGSIAIANTTIRADLGISATRMGVLLSVFSLTYAIAQLPMGILLDRVGERMVLGVGMLLWSITQTATGLIRGFATFVAARIGLALGESPYMVAVVKTVHDWFDVPHRATPMAIVNASTTLGQAIAPPLVTVIMLAFGWRGMFLLIGVPGLALAMVWLLFYRDCRKVDLTGDERACLHASSHRAASARVSPRQWLRLFRQRSMWGMMLGFGGINYTAWLYMSWMPNYLEAEHHVSVAATGMIAVIPFLMGALGMLTSGVVADALIRRGVAPVFCHKTLLITGLTCSGACTLLVPHIAGAIAAACGIGMALFFTHLAGNSGWGLVQSMSPSGIVASVGTIQNFGSFVCASFGPVITGWLLDRTHSFHLTLDICGFVSVLGALFYLLLVRNPIRD